MSKKTITLSIEREALLDAVPQLNEISPRQWQAQLSRIVREILSQKELDIDPSAPLPNPGVRMRIGIPATLTGRFDELVSRYGLPQSDVLIHLLMQYGRQTATEDAESIIRKNPLASTFIKRIKSAGYDYRPAQVETYLSLAQPMREGKIALVEAGTGTGKSVAMLMAAEHWSKQHGKRCVIAVPSLNILRQMKNEAERLGVNASTIIGRQQFVSEQKLNMLMNKLDKAQQAQILWWIENRAQQADWSIDDFMLHVEVNRDWVVLETVADASDRGFLAWKKQFEREDTHESEVVICTHSMLALDAMLRQRLAKDDDEVSDLLYLAFNKEQRDNEDDKGFYEYVNAAGKRIAVITEESGKLPAYPGLIVDEAHLLERNIAEILSRSVSLMRLRWDLSALLDKVTGIKKSHIRLMDELIDAMRNLPANNAPSSAIALDRPLDFEWLPLAKKIAKIKIKTAEEDLKKLQPEDLIRLANLTEDLKNLEAVLSGKLRWAKFSPKRAFPSLHAGSPNVGSRLAILWGSVQAAGLVSATLFVPTKGKGYSANHMINLLSLEKSRVVESRITPPAWLKAPIKEISCDLSVMPADDADDDFERWMDELAPRIQKIVDTAAGGVLILSNALDAAYALTERIKEINVSPLFYPTLGQQRERAVKLAKSQERLVWISVGAAWTGLDFSGAQLDLPPTEDNVLTDLVILRAPFGQNHTITHLWRKIKNPNYPWEMYEGYFTFRQGLGRLVRREGLPQNRRIWIMDKRICCPQNNQFFSILNREVRQIAAGRKN